MYGPLERDLVRVLSKCQNQKVQTGAMLVQESIRSCNFSGSSKNRTVLSAKRRQELGNVEFNMLLGELMCLGDHL